MDDFFIVMGCGILGLMAHGATTRPWLEWTLRFIISVTLVGEVLLVVGSLIDPGRNPWQSGVSIGTAIATTLCLIFYGRKLYSTIFSFLDNIFSGAAAVALYKKTSIQDVFAKIHVFLPNSIPHMVALFIYISTFATLMGAVDPDTLFGIDGSKLPSLPLPIPVPIDTLFSYNGLGLVLLSFCGIGIFVKRDFKAAIERLGWKKPTGKQVAIGLGLIVFSFFYDYLWSLYTHNTGQDMATKLAVYNSGTFSVVGGAEKSLILALATAIFAGVGEETLIRGALQPVFGIFPAAVLHGILHAQFTHAPIFMIQVALWSCVMGLIRKYTNTTTTIIGHAGFNFLTTFLFSFNP
ncbi:MAG TPA: CPBP family intramembrane metalloprotease [Candidatus Melainabacteria bacterium]|nr:CPBP family intramembrane metalloprotease [Candidatus Melainabacteria bacterium]